MFPKKERVTREEFASLQGKSKSARSLHFRARFLLGGATQKKIAVATPSRIFKKAVLRNSARRKVRAIIREERDALPQGIILALFVEKDIKDTPRKELSLEIQGLFKEIKKLS